MVQQPTAQSSYPVRLIRTHLRLFVSVICGAAAILSMPGDWRWATRLLVGWDSGVTLYLVLAYITMARADVGRIRRRASRQDEGDIVVLILTAAAALASLGAIIAQLSAQHLTNEPAHLLLATTTIVLSWIFTHTIFALHYAHQFYGAGHKESGLLFPGEKEPDYWDFIYFSLVIGMTSQVSDVAVASRSIRRVVAAHGVIAFFFNATLLALTVNIAASALSNPGGG